MIRLSQAFIVALPDYEAGDGHEEVAAAGNM